MQMLGGASERVPTVSVPGWLKPSAFTSTAVSGSTVGVVYLSSPGPWAAAARFVGSALALSTPGGAHWSTFARAGAARLILQISTATRAATDDLTAIIQAR
jgi:hypothetical protein